MSDTFARATTVFRDAINPDDPYSHPYEPFKSEVRALHAIQAAWAEGWVSNIVNEPTGDELPGERYIVGTSPTGVFVNSPNCLAILIDDVWNFADPSEGVQLYNRADDRQHKFDGTSWNLSNANDLGLGTSANYDESHFALSARTITAGLGLSGGGALTSDLALSANVLTVAGRTGDVTIGVSDVSGAAASGSNSDITALTGLTAVGVEQFGSAGLKYKPKVYSSYLNLQRWLDGAYINAGRASDATFSSLQDALDLGGNTSVYGTPRYKKILFDGYYDPATVDCWVISAPLKVYPHSGLLGHGSGVSAIKLNTNANCQAVILGNPAYAGDDISYAQYIEIGGFKINANSLHQSAAATDAIFCMDINTISSNCHINVHDVTVAYTYAGVDAFRFGRNCAAITGNRLRSYSSGGHGFHIQSTDAQFGGLDSGHSKYHGIFADQCSLTQIRGFKSWWAGEGGADPGAGLAIYKVLGGQFYGQAQDCFLYGVKLYGVSGTPSEGNVVDVLVDSCGGTAVDLTSGYARNNDIRVQTYNRTGGGPSIVGYSAMTSAVAFKNDSTVSNNHVSVLRGAMLGTPSNVIDPATPVIRDNRISILGYNDTWTALSGQSTYTPTPQTKGKLRFAVTVPLTINAATGQWDGLKQEFLFAQDATGHAITFDSSFVVTSAPSASANAVSHLIFEFDATSSKWYQI